MKQVLAAGVFAVTMLVLTGPVSAQNATADGAADGAAAGGAAAGPVGALVGGVTGAAVGTAAGVAGAAAGVAGAAVRAPGAVIDPGPTTTRRSTCVTAPDGSQRCDSVETTN